MRQTDRQRGGGNGAPREREIVREKGRGGRKRRRRRNKHNGLTDQSNAQSFVDNHIGLAQDGNSAQNVHGILAMVA